jgi:peptidoglycan/LPS O-acetylase OafA/YrhL
MLLVAVLAQIGAFRSEKDIYTGPDSKYINGSVTVGYVGLPCTNMTTNSTTTTEMAQYLGISSPAYLVNVTRNSTSDWSNDNFCLNATSKLIGPSALYNSMNSTEQVWWKVAMGMWISGYEAQRMHEHEKSVEIQADKAYNRTRLQNIASGEAKEGIVAPELPFIPQYDSWQWIQLGGSWEEHPIIHEKLSYAITNLTTMYAEWANPFNFGLYFPRYDPHTFTIPLEFHGSIFIYVFLLGTAALKLKWRLIIGALLVAYCLRMARWDMALFMGAMLQSELDIRGSIWSGLSDPGIATHITLRQPVYGGTIVRWSCTVLALYFLSYPDAGAEFTPGFMFLSEWVPRYYGSLSGWMFYQAIGALLLLPCVLRSSLLRRCLDRPAVQYLGKISFSFYLVHGPVLHSLGFWLMPRLFDHFDRLFSLLIGYIILLSVALYIAHWWYRIVDVWSIKIGKRLDSELT